MKELLYSVEHHAHKTGDAGSSPAGARILIQTTIIVMNSLQPRKSSQNLKENYLKRSYQGLQLNQFCTGIPEHG